MQESRWEQQDDRSSTSRGARYRRTVLALLLTNYALPYEGLPDYEASADAGILNRESSRLEREDTATALPLSQPSPTQIVEEIARIHASLLERQQPLDIDAHRVLRRDLWDLYL